MSLRDIISATRPAQWTKNLLVTAAFFFAFWDQSHLRAVSPWELLAVVPATILFCLMSGGIYLLNDIMDIEADRAHPVKRLRPVAAGRIPVGTAYLLAFVLIAGSAVGALAVGRTFGAAVTSYGLIHVAYAYGLKRIPFLDLVAIAAGFVLRAVAGALALCSAVITPWLLISTFLLALFLAVAKRRQECLASGGRIDKYAAGSEHLDIRTLDLLLWISASAVCLTYIAYTLWPGTIVKYTSAIILTTPFVVIGVARYTFLVYRRELGAQPEQVLLRDKPIQMSIVLYAVSLALIYWCTR